MNKDVVIPTRIIKSQHVKLGTKNKKGQTFTDLNEMFFEAPRIDSFLTGSEVIKEAITKIKSPKI